MRPVLNSNNYDYDYDMVQPCYFLGGDEEDFYPPPRSQLLPGPSEDIWKKFELLPTPPLSPSRRPSLSAANHLEAVSDLLDDDRNPSAAFLQSFIIQDCMWSSSLTAATKLEKVVSEKLASLRARRNSSKTKIITDRSADEQVGGSRESTEYLRDLHTSATDCIDPSVVFLGEKQREDGLAMEVGSELSLDSPPLSSSDSDSGMDEVPDSSCISMATNRSMENLTDFSKEAANREQRDFTESEELDGNAIFKLVETHGMAIFTSEIGRYKKMLFPHLPQPPEREKDGRTAGTKKPDSGAGEAALRITLHVLNEIGQKEEQ